MGNVCELRKLNYLKYARKMLSSRVCAPIDDFIKVGILPLLMDYLTSKYDNKYVDYSLTKMFFFFIKYLFL